MADISQKAKDKIGYVVSAAAVLLLFFVAIRIADREGAPKRIGSEHQRTGAKRGTRTPAVDRIVSPQRTPPPRGRRTVASKPGSGHSVEVPSPFEDSSTVVERERAAVPARTWAGGNHSWGGGGGWIDTLLFKQPECSGPCNDTVPKQSEPPALPCGPGREDAGRKKGCKSAGYDSAAKSPSKGRDSASLASAIQPAA